MRISCCNKINQNTVPNKNIHENHMNKDINEEEEEKKTELVLGVLHKKENKYIQLYN